MNTTKNIATDAQPAAYLVPVDGWLHESGLLYRLTEGRPPYNCDEINVTMVDGSRTIAARSRRALELLDVIRPAAPKTAPTPQAALAAMRAGGEPVAWMNDEGDIEHNHKPWMSTVWKPLYTHPQPAAQDGERLDHLQKTGSTIELIPGASNFYPMLFRVGGLHKSSNADVRLAIDAAIAAQQGDKS